MHSKKTAVKTISSPSIKLHPKGALKEEGRQEGLFSINYKVRHLGGVQKKIFAKALSHTMANPRIHTVNTTRREIHVLLNTDGKK